MAAAVTISAVLITRNEEARLERCLASLTWADEIVVVDSQSTDRTVEIARAHGATVHTHAFRDFAAQRNFALERALCDWILMIDADEEVTPEAAAEIRRAAASDSADAFRLPRRNRVFGRFLRHGGNYPDYQTRLFRRGRARYTGIVHERLQGVECLGTLTQPLLHDSYASLTDYRPKLHQYTTLEAAHRGAQGERGSWLKVLVLPPAVFLRAYVLKCGFLDGRAGFTAARLGALYAFVTQRKLRRPPPATPSRP